jgi:hypothetical protein
MVNILCEKGKYVFKPAMSAMQCWRDRRDGTKNQGLSNLGYHFVIGELFVTWSIYVYLSWCTSYRLRHVIISNISPLHHWHRAFVILPVTLIAVVVNELEYPALFTLFIKSIFIYPSASTLLLLCFGVKFHPSGVLPRNISLIFTQSLESVLPNNVSKSDLPHHLGARSCK